ncbi:ferredoxin [Saccharothrix isguenensis]
MSALGVEVDRERCVGMGQCVFTAPEVFGQSEEDGRVVVLEQRPAEELREVVEEAAEVCPVTAIVLRTQEGAQR